jgi:hypothetical protein
MFHAIDKRQVGVNAGLANGSPLNARRAAVIRRHRNAARNGRSRRFSRRPRIGPAAGSK